MLSEHWDDYSGIFRSLAFVNGRRVGRHHHIEFTESVFDGSAVEANSYFPSIGVDIVNGADVAVVNLLVVVVLDLHHLVAGGKSPAEAFNLAVAGGIERCLQFDVQRARTNTTPIHRTQHLDVADGIEAKSFRDADLRQFDDAADGNCGIVRRHEVEVAVGSGGAEIRHRALVDAMGAGDDPALCGLPEHFGEPYHRHRA